MARPGRGCRRSLILIRSELGLSFRGLVHRWLFLEPLGVFDALAAAMWCVGAKKCSGLRCRDGGRCP